MNRKSAGRRAPRRRGALRELLELCLVHANALPLEIVLGQLPVQRLPERDFREVFGHRRIPGRRAEPWHRNRRRHGTRRFGHFDLLNS